MSTLVSLQPPVIAPSLSTTKWIWLAVAIVVGLVLAFSSDAQGLAGADDAAPDRDKSSAAAGPEWFRRSRVLDVAGGPLLRIRHAQNRSGGTTVLLHPDVVSREVRGGSFVF